MTSPARAGIYVRLSRDRIDETSTERQEADCRALCAAKSYDVKDLYVDVGLSGYADVVRPQYQRLLADVRTGTVDTIVVWKLDRLTRRGIREIAPLLDLLDATGARLVAVQDSIDTSSPMGEAVLGLLASMAKQESANISTRTRSAKAHAAQRGLPAGGGRRPFGYTDNKLTGLVDDEVKTLREARDRLLGGESMRSIATDLDARGIVNSSGTAWMPSNLGRMLRSPHLAGLRSHTTDGRRELSVGTWEPIFTTEEHRALIGAAGHQYPAVTKRHLLTGLVRCSSCDALLRHKTTQRGGAQYVCHAKGCVVVNAGAIEDLIDRAVTAVLDSPAVRDAMSRNATRDDMGSVTKLLEADREALRELSNDFYVDRTITRDEFTPARAALSDRIALSERRLAAATSEPVVDNPVDLWSNGDIDDRRMVLGRLVQKITVHPTRVRGRSRFDEGRVTIRWTA